MKRKYVIIICIIAIIATLAISASAIYMNELNKNNTQNITQNTTKPIQNNTTIVNNTTIIKEEINYNVEVKEPQKEDSSDRAGTLNQENQKPQRAYKEGALEARQAAADKGEYRQYDWNTNPNNPYARR